MRRAVPFSPLELNMTSQRRDCCLPAPSRTPLVLLVRGPRLGCRLFIDAKDCGMLGWIGVEPNDIGRFFLKVRIVGSHVTFDPVGLQPRTFPDPSNHHVRGSRMSGQLAATPLDG